MGAESDKVGGLFLFSAKSPLLMKQPFVSSQES